MLNDLTLLTAGVEAWNQWRNRNEALRPQLLNADLSGRTLRYCDLSNADMYGAKLDGADLSGANLYQAELYGASLRNARLHRADMRGAKLHEANLSGADLSEADLFRVDFISTALAGASFRGARCDTTAFSRVDLSGALFLNTVVHTGPSSIDIATLTQSGQSLATDFLVGAGVPEALLTYLPSLLWNYKPIQYHSLFVSHSHKDEPFARALFERLRAAGLVVWFAPEAMQRGGKIHEQVDAAIQRHDKLLVILSNDSMASAWVVTEIKKAMRREAKEHRRILFPIRLVPLEALREWECIDSDSGKDIGVELREYFIPDFSRWGNATSFQTALDGLLRDLRKV